ncbi:hypothetical protein [Paracoccus onubensis]|uniref:Uncharacterized protein n=1 Tax=Paracoccus onubensis TaxID=1675788 RepID=A0A418SN80_9RHOB|nr:hypothetical protein [Paracoccus onubensis]RJE82362.1 hypothetical protein D3P04_19685 [Paracoccus onubensis]
MYLPFGFLLARLSLLALLPVIVMLLEALCFWLYRFTQRGSTWSLLLLSYLSVGDIVWLFGALIFGALSALMPVWGYAGMVIVWLSTLGLNIHIARHLGISRGRDADVSAIISEAEIGSSKKYAALRNMDRIPSVWVSFGLAGIGLLGIIITYVIGRDDWLLLSLSVGFLGLSCGFSPQIRPLLLVMHSK